MDSFSSRLDGFARSILLSALLAGAAFICMRGNGIADPDIWWHLRTGEWILNHGAVPHADPFSILGMARPWEAYSWLFDLLALKLFLRWGLVGLVSYSTGMVLAIAAAIYHLARRLQSDFAVVVLLTFVAIVCISPLFTPRPWLFTILFFVLETDVLMHVRKGGKTRDLVWLPLMFALWANLHIQFIYGLLMLGAAALEPTAAVWRTKEKTALGPLKLWGLFVACCLATLVNPYGWGIYRTAYGLASQSGVLSTVSEMQSMSFRQFSDYAVLFLALGAVGALAWNRRFPLFETGMLTFATIVSFRSLRDAWVVAVLAIAVLASELPSEGRERGKLPALALLLVTGAVGLLVFLSAAVLEVSNPRLQELVAKEEPVRAVQFAKDHNFGGPLYNTYDWGGYLIWNLPALPVSIDGRAALHGDQRIDRSLATWNGERGWASDPMLSSARLVIAPIRKPLAQLLRMDSRFELAFEDNVAAVFIARNYQSPVAVPTH